MHLCEHAECKICECEVRRSQSEFVRHMSHSNVTSVSSIFSVAHLLCKNRLHARLHAGLGRAAVVHLNVDLGIFVTFVSEALELAAVVQQVEGQAETQHAQHQETHVHLGTA